MNKKIKYSVSVLRESKITNLKQPLESKTFEESIILIKEEENFFENSEEFILEYFNKNIQPLKYKNSYGEDVHCSIVKIIDHFEIIEEVEFENFTEVYSRFIIGNVDDDLDSIVNRFFQ